MAQFNSRYCCETDTSSDRSAWEKFLNSLDIPESSCVVLMAAGTQQGESIRSWVWNNYATRYVPEYILDALGLCERLIVRWPGTDGECASFAPLREGR
jgi:hypothetical protein